MSTNQIQADMQRYYALPNPNLRSYLKRQASGVPIIVRTPFAGKADVQDVCDEWMQHLSGLAGIFQSLLDYEIEMRAKVGPMSYQQPMDKRLPSLMSYYSSPSVGEPVPQEVVTQLLKSWSSVRGLRLRSVESVLQNMKLSTNSGSPYFTKRNRLVESLLPFSIVPSGGSNYTYKDRNGEWLLTATIGWRGQEGGPSVEDVKQRDLWMFPFAANVLEARCYQPLIESFQRMGHMPTWEGNTAVDERITRLFDTKRAEDPIVVTDFTKFDQHYGPDMQQCTLDILSGLFSGPEFDEWARDIYPMKYNIPICYDWGKFMIGPHGMASGSGGTNADETLGHSALQLEAAIRHGSDLNPSSMCLGDDGILSYSGIRVEDVVKTYTAHGLEMNLSKQSVATDYCEFLRRWHHGEHRVGGICVGVYPTMRALGHLCMMERWIDPDKWGARAVAMRQLSIINNCEYHPLGEEFIEFCMERDKFRLGIDIPGFLENLDAIYQESKANDSLHVSYSAEFGDPRPPSEWWVVRYLRSKS